MRLITTDETRPAYNLAAEEYILKELTGDVFFLWRNAPSVIIGKNQNAYAEINIDYVESRGITVVRRLTGGGAVFHDLGNVNYSFFTDVADDGGDVSFARFCAPVVDYLRSLGLDADFSGRNDVTVAGMKVSGSAQTRIGSRFLHHGTLLFGTDMSDLSGALAVHPLKVQSHGIRSVGARVTNISSHLANPMSVTGFMDGLLGFVRDSVGAAAPAPLPAAALEAAARIAEARYCRWDWNFGENPDYSFSNCAKFPGGLIEVRMNINEEVIDDIRICGDFFAYGDISVLEGALRGVTHRREDIARAIQDIPLSKYIGGITAPQLLATMF